MTYDDQGAEPTTIREPTLPTRTDATTGTVPDALRLAEEAAKGFARQSRADATWRAYKTDWQAFRKWSEAHGLAALPASAGTVAMHLAALAETRSVATVSRRLAAISVRHQRKGFAPTNPARSTEVRAVMAGIRRTKRTAPMNAKAPAMDHDVAAMVARLDASTMLGMRDRALLLLGFAGAFRRSELVSLDVSDVAFSDEGVTVTLRRSKTDQTGKGRKVGVPCGRSARTCPVLAVRAWLDAASVAEGPMFRSVNRHGQVIASRLSDRAVALVVKRHALAVGLDPSQFAGHSLRSGFATSAAAGGASERAIMRQTGHKSLPMVRRYIRDGSLFRDNAAGFVKL